LRGKKPIWILLQQEVVSGSGIRGPYASLQLTPDRYHASTSLLSFFTGLMPFLPPSQQCQSTEGTVNEYDHKLHLIIYPVSEVHYSSEPWAHFFVEL